jgi:ubiquinol-cytochrome c reductase cytochrome c subunit
MLQLVAAVILALLPSGAAPAGQTLYLTNCSSCHGDNGQGSAYAPSLIDRPAPLIHFMLDTGRMPAPIADDNDIHRRETKFTQQQIDELVTYIESFTPHPDLAMPEILPVSRAELQTGQALFAENCAVCHAPGGNGGAVGYDRVAPSLEHATTFVIAEAIRSGPGVMPRFGPDVLTDQQVSDIARYVNAALQTQTQGYQDINAGGLTMGYVGPLAEGIVAWVFGLGSLMLFLRFIGTTK